jgi:cyclopropane fatty-acyl-phospholipid synthase-like methyltransferase
MPSSKLKKIKEYWNKQPCNINHSKKKFLTKEYFEEVKKKKYFVERHIPGFAEFNKYKNKNILEIGCGIGTDAIEFIKNKNKYVGVDYSDKSIEICRTRVSKYKLQKYNPIFISDNCESLNKVKKLNKRFDLIYSFGVIHHTPNMKNCFNAIHKIATKNTEIKIMLYAKNSYKNFLLDTTAYRFEAQKGCPVVYTVDEKDLKRLLSNKFKVIKKTQDFIFPYKIKPYKESKYEKISHFKVMPKKIFNCLEKNIGEHLLLNLKKI